MNGHKPAQALVVDDEKIVRDFLVRFLKLKGIVGIPAERGEDAIEEAKKTHFDLVFVEIRMPGMDGLETLVELKKIDPNIKFVMMSGDNSDARIKYAQNEGAVHCMKKPFDIAELSEVIKDYI